MKKRFATLVTTLALLLASIGSAQAASFTAQISNILFDEQSDLVYIFVVGGAKDRPSCAGSNDYISFKMSRPRANQYIAGLMMAFATGKPVEFQTYGQCIDQSVSDTLIFFQIDGS